jgi:hypothetical protein
MPRGREKPGWVGAARKIEMEDVSVRKRNSGEAYGRHPTMSSKAAVVCTAISARFPDKLGLNQLRKLIWTLGMATEAII